MALLLTGCGTLTQSTADTFCLAYEPVALTVDGWKAVKEFEPRAYRAIMRNNAKHYSECPK